LLTVDLWATRRERKAVRDRSYITLLFSGSLPHALATPIPNEVNTQADEKAFNGGT
jgi:hypothetical protein